MMQDGGFAVVVYRTTTLVSHLTCSMIHQDSVFCSFQPPARGIVSQIIFLCLNQEVRIGSIDLDRKTNAKGGPRGERV